MMILFDAQHCAMLGIPNDSIIGYITIVTIILYGKFQPVMIDHIRCLSLAAAAGVVASPPPADKGYRHVESDHHW